MTSDEALMIVLTVVVVLCLVMVGDSTGRVTTDDWSLDDVEGRP